ncbi:hypothetical protein K474DRAFT_192485 [Panus rudis PR-1116 ss-1]|nr:hypothetical protein K474DRAFT_192485 [Panus rudis PR-1116 ss-1]
MSFSYAPDFVIKKKRKRSRKAIDPCLGYYPASPTPITDETQAKLPTKPEYYVDDLTAGPSSIVPGHTVKARENPERTGSLNAKQVTVEDFLRWSVHTPPSRRTYAKKKKYNYANLNEFPPPRIAHQSDDDCHSPIRPSKRRRPGRVILDSSSDYEPGTCEESEAASSPRKSQHTRPKKPQKPLPLATRMRTAALLSHVDLPPTEPGDAPPPLPLVPAPNSPATPISRKWKYVDPRTTSLPYDFEIMPAQTSRRSPKKKSRRVRDWLPPLSSCLTDPLPKARDRVKTIPETRPELVPLKFIPLRTHEKILVESFRRPKTQIPATLGPSLSRSIVAPIVAPTDDFDILEEFPPD